MTMSGEISIGPSRPPINGAPDLSTGAVTRCRDRTIELYGSGFTQLMIAAR